jgi:hypothetical protein
MENIDVRFDRIEARLLAPTDRHLAQKVRDILNKSNLCRSQQISILWNACTRGNSRVWCDVVAVDYKKLRKLVDAQEVLQSIRAKSRRPHPKYT